METPLLLPVVVLVLWTMIIWIWMYATRIPAMQRHRIEPQSAKHPGDIKDRIPSSIRAIADNYNHLHEQPVLFYALAFTLHLADAANPLTLGLVWAYVGLRIVHSLVQTLWNRVVVRFTVFMLASLVLKALAILALLAVL